MKHFIPVGFLLKWHTIFFYQFDIGIYSRGKSHVLRMAVPIQLLLNEFKPEDDNDVCW